MNIVTTAGYQPSKITKDHSKCASQGYMMSPKDWRNFEATVYFMWESGTSDEEFVIYGRGGTHTGSHGCEGFSYKCDIRFSDGNTRFAKEQWHVSYVFTSWKDKLNIGSPKNKWIGMKFIVYNINNNKHAKLELWVDNNDINNWRKADEFVDDGGWGNSDDCGSGTKKDQIGTWGGPFVTMRLDDQNKLRFKDFSVREIDINAMDPDQNPVPSPVCPPNFHKDANGNCVPNTPPPEPVPPPPVGTPPNPPPPATGTLVFANLIGVYNINFDETNGCSGLLVDVNPLKIEYNVPLPEDLTNPNGKQALGSGDGVIRCGEHCFSNQSKLKTFVFKRVSLFLSKKGAPTGTLTCRIRSGLDDSLKATMGTINVADLSTNPSLIDFENFDNTYALDNDDKILVEYTAGTSVNHVIVHKNFSDPEDGTNSRFFRYITPNYIPMAADDICGVFYVEQKDQEFTDIEEDDPFG